MAYFWVNRLAEIRKLRGLTATELSVRSGVSRFTIRKIEADIHYAPLPGVMLSLARELGDPDLFRIQHNGDPTGGCS